MSAAAIVPLSLLEASTIYDVSFNGRVNGAAVSRNWSFTTRYAVFISLNMVGISLSQIRLPPAP